MRKIYLNKVAIGFLLVASTASYGADETVIKPSNARQTPESAQQFIIKLAEKNAITHEVKSKWGWNVGASVAHLGSGRYKTFEHTFPPIPIKNVSALSKCQTRFDYDVPESVDTRPPGYGSIGYPLLSDNRIINWKSVTGVQKWSSTVIFTEGQITRAFNVGSSELGERLKNAMEFLRKSCDDTSDTGF